MNVWYDILILSNGLNLLVLYRYFAKIQESERSISMYRNESEEDAKKSGGVRTIKKIFHS
jgi:hypothetical protein